MLGFQPAIEMQPPPAVVLPSVREWAGESPLKFAEAADSNAGAYATRVDFGLAKSEIRIAESRKKPECRSPKLAYPVHSFEFRLSFDTRISGFGFHARTSLTTTRKQMGTRVTRPSNSKPQTTNP